MLDIMIDGKKKTVKVGKRVRFGNYEILIEKVKIKKLKDFSKTDEKKILELKEEFKLLN